MVANVGGTGLMLGILLLSNLVSAHSVIKYPGWRGNTLTHDSTTFPEGMQSVAPCGGIPVTQNRTVWPIGWGAIAVQPGWYTNNQYTWFTINLGLGEDPDEFPHQMRNFSVTGPTNGPFPGAFCLTQVPLPEGVELEDGDLGTIQVLQRHVNGRIAHNCIDVVFREDRAMMPKLNMNNCFNSTDVWVDATATSAPTGPPRPSIGGQWGHDLSAWSTLSNSRAALFGQTNTTESTEAPATPSPTSGGQEPEPTENAAPRAAWYFSHLLGLLLFV